jgi:flagellar assembly protein FliH
MSVQKYMFDTQFDALPPAPPPVVEEIPAEPAPPPPPVFSEGELEAARQQALAQGRAEGLQQGRTEALTGQDKLLAQLLDSIGFRLAEVMTEQAARFAQSQETVLQIALTIARKLLPATLQRQGLIEIEAAVLGVLAELMSEPRLVVRVHDSQLDTVTIKLQREAEQRGYAGKLVFLADAELGPSDCKVEWADGGLERDTTRLWNEIDKAVAHVLQTGPLTPMSPLSHGRDGSTAIDS